MTARASSSASNASVRNTSSSSSLSRSQENRSRFAVVSKTQRIGRDRVTREDVEGETGLIVIETPGNPTCTLVDINAVVAQAGDVPVLVVRVGEDRLAVQLDELLRQQAAAEAAAGAGGEHDGPTMSVRRHGRGSGARRHYETVAEVEQFGFRVRRVHFRDG